MEVQKEREAFQKFCEENFDFEHHEQTYFDEQTQCYENDIGEDTESINMAWMAWQAAKAQAVPEGFVWMPKEPTQNIYRTFYDAFNLADAGNTAQNFKVAYKAMIEALEPTND